VPVLVFRHGLSGPIGLLGDALALRQIEWRYVDLWVSPEEDPLVEDAQAVVSLGGPMSVNDSLPWLRREERYINRAISSGVPVLGICLGAQLLAKCLGARVGPMRRKEIGWYPVRFTAAGLEDRLFRGLSPEQTFFHWHGENFDLPAGAERLAESDLCANQAFRAGSSLYGLQFHPEVTAEIIGSWCDEDAACGELREAEGDIDPKAHRAEMGEVAGQFFGRWCDLVATR
jgi:GMP synthase (glutamine-hydrolysing)